ncbi:MAG: BlaI/MecI/CopY family transcriptional regulator [Planctomycetota bacterium]
MSDAETSLSPTEWEVMKVLWDHGPLAARDVFAKLPPDADGAPARGWAYKTVKTLLSRLVAKGAIDYDQIGNSYLYRPAVDRDAMSRQEVGGVLERLTGPGAVSGGVLSSAIAQFLGGAELSDAEIDKLQAILDRKRGQTPDKTPRKRGRRS